MMTGGAVGAVDEVPVIIVGGGPVGLTTSLLCSFHGVPSLLVEHHPGTSIFPKARFINARTMEIFRQLLIEDALRAVAIPHSNYVLWAHSLAGEELARRPVETMSSDSVRDWSPTWGCTATQDVFEPVLLAQAQRQKLADIRFNTQFLTLSQDKEHVVAQLLDRQSGREWTVRARYLVGADGAHSPVRNALGIRMVGEPVLTHSVNVLFQADLDRFVADREINICFITNPQAAGLLLYNGGDRWRFTAFYYPDRGERPEDYTAERCQQLIRTAVGAPDVTVQVESIFAWSDAALVAERFGDHRVFLVGDAEHLMAPAGGFGMSVGIQDAHNLAWKLAATLRRWAGPALLDSYQAERAPISRQMTDQMRRNALAARAPSREGNDAASVAAPSPTTRPALGRPEFFREHGLVFGATYDSKVIVPDGTAPVQVANPVTDYLPTARPGSRAPHVWLERGAQRISTLDLFGPSFVLLVGVEDHVWRAAAMAAADSMGLPLQTYTIGQGGDLGDAAGAWAHTYGVDEQGAALVRPDGYVAWRNRSGSPEEAAHFGEVLREALARG